VAGMDHDALAKTLTTGLAHYWSRERRALWRKGETSGHTQHVDGVFADCDRDTLLVQVHQDGVACHTGARTCFFTRLAGSASPSPPGAGPAFLEVVERVLQSRKVERPAGSYTASLFERGEAQICRKLGEEATEGVTAALGGAGGGRGGWEGADLELQRATPPGGMLADATCEDTALRRPLDVLTRHLTFGLKERVVEESGPLTVGGRSAQRAVLRGSLDGTPVEVEAIVIKGDQ